MQTHRQPVQEKQMKQAYWELLRETQVGHICPHVHHMCVCMCFYPCISTNLSTQQNPIHEETQKDIAHTHTHIHRGRPPVSPQMPGQLKQTGIKLAESLQKEPRNKPCSSYSQSHIKNSESQSPVHLRQANEPDAVQHLWHLTVADTEAFYYLNNKISPGPLGSPWLASP